VKIDFLNKGSRDEIMLSLLPDFAEYNKFYVATVKKVRMADALVLPSLRTNPTVDDPAGPAAAGTD
jgi:hypothetical protein